MKTIRNCILISILGVFMTFFQGKYSEKPRAGLYVEDAKQVSVEALTMERTAAVLTPKTSNSRYEEVKELILEILTSNSDSKTAMVSDEPAARIVIPGTIINYPVMQTDNNEYYLNHGSDGKLSAKGALFMDYECQMNAILCKNIIIYGHNMKDKTMFGSLKNYKSQQYSLEHPIIYLQTNGQWERAYRIFSVYLIHGTYQRDRDEMDYRKISFEDDEEFQNWIDFFAGKTIVETGVRPNNPKSVITLSTCSNDFTDARLVIMAAEQ